MLVGGALDKGRKEELRALSLVLRIRERWPELTCYAAAVATEVAPLLAVNLERGKFGAELFLTQACARRERIAIGILEREFFGGVRRAIRRVCSKREFIDEAQQTLCERLLAGTRPRIGVYAGRGPLEGWLGSAAYRTALNLKRSSRHHEGLKRTLTEDVTASLEADAQTNRERAQNTQIVQTAFNEALREVSGRERAMLFLRYIDSTAPIEIGELYGVNRSTVTRSLAGTRTQLRKRVVGSVSRLLRVSPSEARQLILDAARELELRLADHQPAARVNA